MVLSSTPGASELGDLGWGFKSIGRGIKKAGRKAGRVTKRVGKGVVKVSVKSVTAPVAIAKKVPVVGSVVKLGEKLALLPLRYLIKAALSIGRTLCKAPPQLLELAATQAGVDPSFIPLFCKAVRENKFSLGSVRRLLPPALKVAAKLAAAGMFPPIVPALAIVRRIPYVGKFAGADFEHVNTPLVRKTMEAMQIVALADYLDCLDDADAETLKLGAPERAALYDVVAGQVELAEAADRNALVLGGVTIGVTALGFWLLFRE